MNTISNEKIENAARARNYCKGKTLFSPCISTEEHEQLKRIYASRITQIAYFDSRKDKEK